MGTSPDVGGSRGLGKPQVMDFRELEQTAYAVIQKENLGVVKDTLQVPFEQMGKDMWKYQNASSKPVLDSKVMRGVVHGEISQPDKKEEESYENLLDRLPLNLSMQLRKERKLPMHLKTPKFIVLEMVLSFAARALAKLDRFSEINPKDHQEEMEENLAYANGALNLWIAEAEEIKKAFRLEKAFKEGQALRDAKVNYLVLKNIQEGLRSYLNAPEEEKKTIFETLSKDIEEALLRIEKKEASSVSTLTEFMVKRLIPLLTAHRLGPIGLVLAQIDLVLVPYLKRRERKVVNLLTEVAERASVEEKRAIPSVFAVGIALYNSFVLAASGIRGLRDTGDPRLDKEHIQSLALSLGTSLIAHSGFLTMGSSKIFTLLGLKVEDTVPLVINLDIVAMNVLPLNAALGKNEMKSSEQFRSGLIAKMTERLEALRDFVQGNIDDDTIKDLSTAIRQGLIALKRNEHSGYFEALGTALRPYKISLAKLAEECALTTSDILVLHDLLRNIQRKDSFTRVVTEAA